MGTRTVPLGASTAVDEPLRRLVDEESGLGIGTGVGGTPEGRADPDLSGLARI
jgi:hypothetical protein